MKTRNGFVSNSSSSSFICDVCGEEVSGWDMSLEEAYMAECEGGHTFCVEHTGKDFEDFITKESALDYLNNSTYYKDDIPLVEKMDEDQFCEWLDEGVGEDFVGELRYQLPSCCCPICNMETVSNDMLVDYLVKTNGITKKTVLDEIRKENKRRKKLYNYEYIAYAVGKLNTTKESMIETIKKQFKNYDEMYDFIYN